MRKSSFRPVALPLLGIMGLAVQGCSFVLSPPPVPQEERTPLKRIAREDDGFRRIEVEVENLDRGLPCTVIYRTSPDNREVIWRARFEKGFCHREANQSRLRLEAEGWTCRIENPKDLPKRDEDGQEPSVVMAWLCEQGIGSEVAAYDPWPPLPDARPIANAGRKALEPERTAPEIDPALKDVIERDLSAIGRTLEGPSVTGANVSAGDLNGDGLDDAVIVLIRRLDNQRWDRTLMAYVGNGTSYSLGDIQVSPVARMPAVDQIDLEIADGTIRLETCCGNGAETAALALENGELSERPPLP